MSRIIRVHWYSWARVFGGFGVRVRGWTAYEVSVEPSQSQRVTRRWNL